MKTDRWAQVERIYNSALERKPEERDDYLNQACAVDDSLRKEVESLIACDSEAKRFIEKPALDVAARAIAADQDSTYGNLTGKTVLHYRITGKIGAGGMGEVFLDDDLSLGRKVALKFLPGHMQQNSAAHKRFLREARSAAALDHPYIPVARALPDREIDELDFS